MNRHNYMNIFFNRGLFKIIAFLLIGVLIFGILQEIFMQKLFPYYRSYDAGKLRYCMGEEKNTINVLICGASHPSRGILPMEMYELYGIRSYNLSTSAQPIEATYFILQEAIKRQNPKVVIWDMSNLYFNGNASSNWKIAMDEMRTGKNKILLAKEYLEEYDDTGETFIELVLPLLGYHTRWKRLVRQDFNLIKKNKRCFSKGGQITSVVLGGISVEDMNIAVKTLLQDTVKDVYEYNGQEFNEWHEKERYYSIDVPDSNKEWFIKIKELCDKNDIQLLAVKIPDVYLPQQYGSAWVEEKYNKTCKLCKEYGVAYYDLLYDTDLHLDFGKDSMDGGIHLNLYGAQKVSANLGSYLKEYYELPDGRSEQWDKDLELYRKVRKVASLELEQDFLTYINMLANEYKDNTIFIAASDDMSQGLNEKEINALRELGLQADYSIALQHSYIAVIENGEVKYEALSNRPLYYSGEYHKSGKGYELYSSGWWTGSGASIKLEGNEYGVNGKGLNFVVYDADRGLVLDSVVFDTCSEYHASARNSGLINQMEEEFERYIMEVEDNRD